MSAPLTIEDDRAAAQAAKVATRARLFAEVA